MNCTAMPLSNLLCEYEADPCSFGLRCVERHEDVAYICYASAIISNQDRNRLFLYNPCDLNHGCIATFTCRRSRVRCSLCCVLQKVDERLLYLVFIQHYLYLWSRHQSDRDACLQMDDSMYQMRQIGRYQPWRWHS